RLYRHRRSERRFPSDHRSSRHRLETSVDTLGITIHRVLHAGMAGDVEEDSDGDQVDDLSRTSEGDEREGHAGRGYDTGDHGHVEQGLSAYPGGYSRGDEHREPIGGVRGDRHAHADEGDEQADQEEHTGQTEL